jgi:hypothetical protein
MNPTIQIKRAAVFPDDATPEQVEEVVNHIGREVGLRFALMLAGMTIIARYEVWNVECLDEDECDFLIDLGGRRL